MPLSSTARSTAFRSTSVATAPLAMAYARLKRHLGVASGDVYVAELALHPGACQRLAEALTWVYLAGLEKWLGAIGPYVDVALFGDDLGGQQGPLLSPATYRRVFAPFHRRM